ncbi:hypothetical protein AT15_07390 [Kosmotoga arenicorallina S304]|uniref:VWFA domain-containing protein n=1 Tax=Kosmotoga arenicorallina S304 TaxID=1453497 RepID=A0A176K2V2_9BACT|nr:hypothetical protein [Kosmotoga arenicorallina]OAA31312.1 hypothetical protein AT15_07390 [Kosmotoga arenicorallina S304]
MKRLFLGVILMLSTACLALTAINNIDASKFPEVKVQVTTMGYYTPDDLEISEDGVEVTPSVRLLKREPLESVNIYYFLDISGSMNQQLPETIDKLTAFSEAINAIFEGKLQEHFIALSDRIFKEVIGSSKDTKKILTELYSLPVTADEDFGKVINSYKFAENSIIVFADDRDSWKEKLSPALAKSGFFFVALDTGSDYAKMFSGATKGIVFDGERLDSLEAIISLFSRSLWELVYSSPFPELSLHTVEINGKAANYLSSGDEPFVIPETETVEATAGEKLILKGTLIGEIKSLEASYDDTQLKVKVVDQEYSLELIPEPGIGTLTLRACSLWKCFEKNVNLLVIEREPALEATIFWDNPEADLDLYVIEPSEAVYFLNSKGIGLLTCDEKKEPGTEKYRLKPNGKSPPHGRYIIRVHYYSGDGPVEFRVAVYSYGALIFEGEFALEFPDSRNCLPDAIGPDWIDVIKINF